MNKARAGFMLLEAILAIVIVTICLSFIAQALLTNFRTGLRFQQMVRSMIVMQNRLGVLYATQGSDDQIDPSKPLDKPYEGFTLSTSANTVNDHLEKISLVLNWPQGGSPGHLDTTTIVYSVDENPSNNS